MATINAKAILERASTIIQDETNIRWPPEELLDWLNDAQREIVRIKPDAFAKNEARQLTQGTKQELAPDGIALIDVPRNMGIDGQTPGKVIRQIPRRQLDDQRPDWHSQDPAQEVDHFMFDSRDPKHFYVWPPSDGNGYAEQIYSSAPDEVTDPESETITLDDVYANTILDFILYRAYMKDADYAGNAQRAAAAYNSFLQALGLQGQVQAIVNPNVPQEARAANLMSTPGGGPQS